MKIFFFVSFIAFYTSTFAQKYPWTNKCENEKSNVEIGTCLENSCKEATKYFEQKYNDLYIKVSADLKKAEQGSMESQILSKYVTYLPKLKKALTDGAISSSEIEVAAGIDGSGYEIIKKEFLLKKIESNIETFNKIKSELPSFE
jgi:hypothetical protein